MGSSYWLMEVLLALAALLVASQFWLIARDPRQARAPALLMIAGQLALALAAFAGAYRYGINPHSTALHHTLSQLSSVTTFLSAGIALLWARVEAATASRGAMLVAVALLVALALGGTLMPAAAVRECSALGLLLWLVVALFEVSGRRRLPARLALPLAMGAALVIFAGLAIGTGAMRVLGLARTNWFHLLLAAGALSLLCARPLFARGGQNG
ncbi:hypothetical protein [Microbulbifer sp. SAOS-129_SWC]|uniref:hypothetical protein n=1 Tax=Microbulbifer sp. SAOS-129_SWC TaxID=3145235 RepID=UPI00321771DB